MPTTRPTGSIGIPAVGLGTLGNVGDAARELVGAALAEGYRHVDTAEYYGNEGAVGEGIAQSSVPRGDIWLTTKILHPTAPPPTDVRSAAEDSLRRLGVAYVDALLIHWPNRHAPLDHTLEVFCALREEGKARTIGVSNFPTDLLGDALRSAAGIAIEQVEYHPYIDQRAVLDLAREHDVVVTAHSPLARGRVVDDPVLVEIGLGHGLTAPQVALRWLVQQDGVVAIPGGRPGEVQHLRDDLAVLDVALTDEDMRRIAGLATTRMRIVDGPHAPVWDEL